MRAPRRDDLRADIKALDAKLDYTSINVAGGVHVPGFSLVLNVQGDASITGTIDGAGTVGSGGGAGGYLSGAPGQNGGRSQLYGWNFCTNSYLSSAPGSPGGQGGTTAFSASNPLTTLGSGALGGDAGPGGNCGGGVAYPAPGSGGAYVAINAASIEIAGRIDTAGTAGWSGSGCVNGPSSGGGGGGGGGDVLLRGL